MLRGRVVVEVAAAVEECAVVSSSGLTAEELIRRLRELAETLGRKSISRLLFHRKTGIPPSQVNKHFNGWNELVLAAGLVSNCKSRIPDDDLMQAMQEIFLAEGKVCTRTRFQKLCRYDVTVYRNRWGNWTGSLLRFREWVLTSAPDFPYLDSLPTECNPVIIARPGGSKASPRAERQYGSPLCFRGLLHAPLNESGVVFLFGMVGHKLGFSVESITPGFPDCEAKRRISKSGDTWERVRIEFEFASRNFVAHGHDPSRCDMIICWEHNWPECPLEVLELKSTVQMLAARNGGQELLRSDSRLDLLSKHPYRE